MVGTPARRNRQRGRGLHPRRLTYDKLVYERCGLDVAEAMRQARANEQVNARRREAFEGLYHFLDENGLLNPVSRFMWRRFGFLG